MLISSILISIALGVFYFPFLFDAKVSESVKNIGLSKKSNPLFLISETLYIEHDYVEHFTMYELLYLIILSLILYPNLQ